MKHILIAVLIILAVNAKEKEPDCSGAVTTYQQISCLDKKYKFWDKQLNRNYKALVAKIKKVDSESKRVIKRLKDAQRAWIIFRDKECIFQSSPMIDGSAEAVLNIACLANMTKQRALELKNFEK